MLNSSKILKHKNITKVSQIENMANPTTTKSSSKVFQKESEVSKPSITVPVNNLRESQSNNSTPSEPTL